MIPENSKNQLNWLDIPLCKATYEAFQRQQERSPELGEKLPPFFTRYPGKLESLIESVKLKADYLDWDIPQVACAYYVTLAKSQVFFNGNKRMSILLAASFLWLNERTLRRSLNDFADLTYFISEIRQPITEVIEEVEPYFRKLVKPL